MGKKPTGGGGGGVHDVSIPPQLYNVASATTGLGQYASALLNPLASMSNWAANIASGGQTQDIPSFQSVASMPVGEHQFGGQGAPWQGTFNPQTGEITWSLTQGGTSRQFNQGFQQAYQQGNISQGEYMQFLSAWNQNLVNQARGPGGSGDTAAQFEAKLGPLLGQAWQDIQEQQQLTKQLPGLEATTAQLTAGATAEAKTLGTESEQLYGQGQSMVSSGLAEEQALKTGTGLYPSQAAYVEQAKQTGETESAAELAKMGLSQSTQSGQLKEQADLAAAATAGQLTQANIQLAQEDVKTGQAQITAAQQQRNLQQGAEKIALAGQALTLGEQTAWSQELASISQQSSTIQKQMWDEAMAGYGAIGNILNAAAQQYGLSIDAYKAVLQGDIETAKNQTAIEQAQIQAASQQQQQGLANLGKLIGGSSSSGGVGGSGLNIGSIIGAIFSIVGAFCWVARAAFGEEGPEWLQFQNFMLLKARPEFRSFYSKHGLELAERLRSDPDMSQLIKHLMEEIIHG